MQRNLRNANTTFWPLRGNLNVELTCATPDPNTRRYKHNNKPKSAFAIYASHHREPLSATGKLFFGYAGFDFQRDDASAEAGGVLSRAQ
eukprot:4616501-Amphidinium_carterae.1